MPQKRNGAVASSNISKSRYNYTDNIERNLFKDRLCKFSKRYYRQCVNIDGNKAREIKSFPIGSGPPPDDKVYVYAVHNCNALLYYNDLLFSERVTPNRSKHWRSSGIASRADTADSWQSKSSPQAIDSCIRGIRRRKTRNSRIYAFREWITFRGFEWWMKYKQFRIISRWWTWMRSHCRSNKSRSQQKFWRIYLFPDHPRSNHQKPEHSPNR